MDANLEWDFSTNGDEEVKVSRERLSKNVNGEKVHVYIRLPLRMASRSLPATTLGRLLTLNRVTQRSVFE